MVKRNSGTSKEDICQNQFTAYVVLAVKRKRQAYIKKKIRDKENQAKREEEQSNWCCTIKVDIENSKGQYIEKDKQEATKDGSESTKIQHGI